MPTGSHLRPAVIAARERLAHGRDKIEQQHRSGSPGIQVCAALADLIDGVLLDLYEAALAELPPRQAEAIAAHVALAPHGGYGRRDVAPYSDVDLMLLAAPEMSDAVEPLARLLSQNIYDCGLDLGFSVRTPADASSLALGDATILTSLIEARFIGGSASLFASFAKSFRRAVHRRRRRLFRLVETARDQERAQFGETVYLLEPNVKRSSGALRDIQLLRWIGFIHYGQHEPDLLHRSGRIRSGDHSQLRAARDFLLRVRNEMHFHAGRAHDSLHRAEQVRIAEVFRFEGAQSLLPVEQFMRSYFHHTSNVRMLVDNFCAGTRPRAGVLTMLGGLVSHRMESDFRVGPVHIQVVPRALDRVAGDLSEVLKLMTLANLYNKLISHETWDTIRDQMLSQNGVEVSQEAADRFLSLLSQPGRLGPLLRRLHELRALEKLVPAMAHARCLLQFNQYHKYTVDEHSIRAVEAAAEFATDPGPLGEAYRGVGNKRLLHLALLLHDLGKGFEEDHCEVGLRIADATAQRLGLPDDEAETLRFLVHQHLLMTHTALWRDVDDPSLILWFAVRVGSPDVLQMLYVLSCADLAAVGPGVLNNWKLGLITQLYRQARRHLTSHTYALGDDRRIAARRRELLTRVSGWGEPAWWREQLEQLPSNYLFADDVDEMLQQLDTLRTLPSDRAVTWGRCLESLNAIEFTVGANESITPGIFYRLTGALSSQGLQILSAEINTLARGVIYDRFYVNDSDFVGKPPQERMDAIHRSLVEALESPSDKPPTFRRVWGENPPAADALPQSATRVRIDNTTAPNQTIIDVFAHDRRGLLYTIARTIFELGLSVHMAKIGTHLDQVVDVFYVTDQQDGKINDPQRLSQIRTRLLEAIEEFSSENSP